MREFQERKKWREIIYSKTALIFLFLVLIFFIYSAVKVYIKSRAAVSKSNEIKEELMDLKQRSGNLADELKELQTESGLEEEIREKFNVSKPGEKLLIIVDKKEENDKINSSQSASGFFSEIWNWMKNIF